ncbi:hypothetical protein [Vibrio rumoiensis]|uniref:Phage abortive infection protein n=1 Tax=Vibrio rumoiensis TaxID=76258 RepID=A0ABW7IZZ1_9VIBR
MKKVVFSIVILVLITPIILYVYQFGIGLWSEQNDWANLGSYLSGFYSPLLTFGTLIILYKQLVFQKKSQETERDIQFCRETYELAVNVLDRIKLIENNLSEKITDYSGLLSYLRSKENPDELDRSTEKLVRSIHDVFITWAQNGDVCDMNNVNIRGQGINDIWLEDSHSVINGFEFYFSSVEELKKYKHIPEAQRLCKRLNTIALVLFPPHVLDRFKTNLDK